MNPHSPAGQPIETEYTEAVDRVGYDFGLSRRSFVQFLSTGLMIAVGSPALAQRSGGRGGPRSAVAIAVRRGIIQL